MNSALLREHGLHPGYIIPSAHWSSIERICGEEPSERSALLARFLRKCSAHSRPPTH
ncbi:hypothetical protein B0G71_0059 [Paraburkholderia sp. BL27I4N3]|nr:hypothetical protein B0G71_0059 [Paraburkholderia sp. BL27I4N3]